MRSPLRILAPALALLATSLASSSNAAAEPPESRFGLVPIVGTGIAGLTAAGSLPSFIGYSSLGAEILGQLRTWGLFLRFDFLSSGNVDSGKYGPNVYSGWNAYSFDAGASYRLFGDSQSIALFLRGGLTYEHWLGIERTNCTVLPFVPDGCNTEGSSGASFEGDALGVNAGARLELPLSRFYIALGANFVPLVTFNTSDEAGGNSAPSTALQPGDIFQLRLDLAIGLRDNRQQHVAAPDQNNFRLEQHY